MVVYYSIDWGMGVSCEWGGTCHCTCLKQTSTSAATPPQPHAPSTPALRLCYWSFATQGPFVFHWSCLSDCPSPDHWHSAGYTKHKPVQLFQVHHRIPPILMCPVPSTQPRSFLLSAMLDLFPPPWGLGPEGGGFITWWTSLYLHLITSRCIYMQYVLYYIICSNIDWALGFGLTLHILIYEFIQFRSNMWYWNIFP